MAGVKDSVVCSVVLAADWFTVGVVVDVEETFEQLPSLLGRQLEHCFPAFTQAQLLHELVLLRKAPFFQYRRIDFRYFMRARARAHSQPCTYLGATSSSLGERERSHSEQIAGLRYIHVDVRILL